MMSCVATAKRAAHLIRIGWTARKVRKEPRESDRLLAKQALAGLFADARGVTMKVGQLFADNGEQTPLRQLVEGIEPLPLSAMLPVLEADLGKPAATIFSTLEESQAAASLGQVHAATLRDGTPVAVKIRYPDIANAVDAELQLAGLMPGIGPVKRWGFDLGAYKQTLKSNMARELDYRSEAERQQRYGERVQISGLRVPRVYMALCSKRVLVQSWESGVSLEQAAKWPRKDRLLIGRTLLMTLFKSLFVAGEVHGDPHRGNYLYQHEHHGQPQVALLDYGCTVAVAASRRLALLKLILACKEGTPISSLGCFAALGFDAKKLSYIDAELPALCQILFRPFLLERPIELNEWRLGEDFATLLGDNRWWFRSAGPADLLLLMRAFQGLASQLQRLEVRLPWWPLLEQAVGADVIRQARALELPQLSSGTPIQAIASRLRVSVMEGEESKVALSMPAGAALDLDNIIPEDVLERIRHSQEVDIVQVITHIRRNGIVPQDLFAFDDGPKSYRVWLE